LFAPEQHQFFLIHFRQAVNGFAANRRVLRSRNTPGDRAAKRAMHFPIAFAQLFHPSHRWKNHPVLGTFAGAFAVNGLRARDDDFA
jgi:hypothetical protein